MPSVSMMPPSTAIEVVTSYGVPNAALVIRDYAAAGIVRSAARVLEWIDADGIHTTGHDEEVPTDLWKRIIREEADADIWLTGTLRLEGDEPTDDRPHVILTGIRFATLDIHKIGWSHRGYVSRKGSEVGQSKEAPITADADQPVAAAPRRKRRSPAVDPIRPGDILCTIAQACNALSIGRTKAHELLKEGRLVRVDDVAGVRITVASVMVLGGKVP